MLYRAEIFLNGKTVYAHTAAATHPQQMVRRMLAYIRQYKLAYSTVFVANESGQVWAYQIKRLPNGMYDAVSARKSIENAPQYLVREVFAGNKQIKDLL